jgi:hypothetical protein
VSDKLQKKSSDSLKENTQYVLAFSLIAMMLWVAHFPMFVIVFFGIFAYFLWKTFSQPSRSETREIFEFYLAANEILRDDERRWFGFEIQEVAARGERILQLINGAPPLVYFTLGALYHKIGDFKSAVNHLSYIVENENADEAKYVYPSPDLRNYAKVLRKIEREPAEAPQTSAAVRALERARRNRGKVLLENSRAQLNEQKTKKIESSPENNKFPAELGEANGEMLPPKKSIYQETNESISANNTIVLEPSLHKNADDTKETGRKEKTNNDVFANRKPISEVLYDIYDRK